MKSGRRCSQGDQAAAVLVRSCNPEWWQLLLWAGSLLLAGSSPAPMQLKHTRATCSSARHGAQLFSLAEGCELPGIMPRARERGPAGSQLSPAPSTCKDGYSQGLKEAQSLAQDGERACCSQACSFLVITEGPQVPLWTSLLGKRAFKRYPTSSAPKSHVLHNSHVRKPRQYSHLQARLPGPSPPLTSSGSQPFGARVLRLVDAVQRAGLAACSLLLESPVLDNIRPNAEPTSSSTGFP